MHDLKAQEYWIVGATPKTFEFQQHSIVVCDVLSGSDTRILWDCSFGYEAEFIDSHYIFAEISQ